MAGAKQPAIRIHAYPNAKAVPTMGAGTSLSHQKRTHCIQKVHDHAPEGTGTVAFPWVTERVTEAATLEATCWSSAGSGVLEMGMKNPPREAAISARNRGHAEL